MSYDKESINRANEQKLFEDEFDPMVLGLSDEEKARMAKGLHSAGNEIQDRQQNHRKSSKETGKKDKKKSNSKKVASFFEKVVRFFLQLFMGMTAEDYERKQKLKEIRKELTGIHPHIYNFRKETVQPVLARQVFTLFRHCIVFKPAFEAIFRGQGSNSHLDLQLFFLHVASDNPEVENVYKFSEQHLAEQIEHEKENIVRKRLDGEVKQFLNAFSEDEKKQIDRIYTELMNVSDMLDFNYSRFLGFFNENFDPSTELEPEFGEVLGQDLIRQLKNLENMLLEVNTRFMPVVFDTAKKFFESEIMESMDPEHAKALHSSMEEQSSAKYRTIVYPITHLLQGNKLTLLIRYITGKLDYEAQVAQRKTNFFAEFSKNLLASVDERLNKLTKRKTDIENANKIQELFALDELPDNYVYSLKMNEILRRHGMQEFLYPRTLNMTMLFFKDKYYAYMKRMLNKLLVGGNFKNGLTRRMISDEFYHVDDLYAECNNFILLVDKKQEKGEILDKMIDNYKGDLPSKKALNARITTLNQELYELLRDVRTTTHNLQIAIGQVAADIKNDNPEVIGNLKEVGGSTHQKFIQDLKAASQDLNLFCALMSRLFQETPH